MIIVKTRIEFYFFYKTRRHRSESILIVKKMNLNPLKSPNYTL